MLYRQLRLVLSTEDKEQYLEQPIPTAPVVVAPDQPIPPAALATYNEWVKNQKEIVVMIGKGPEKQKQKSSKAAKGVQGKGKAPSITRGIISVSRLYKDGYVNRFKNDNTISVSRNNLVYFSAITRDDIYEIDLSSSNINDSSVCAIINKRAELNLDSTLLWHCCLRHINKKRIEKLQHDRLLNSTDIESFEKCVSYMSGKMSRKPYSHQVERAKDLLGLSHTDVCGPFNIMSRQGAYYFVTFTDDFSRYGYVYLLKHKHEVFETFKVFQKEVENQLGKTIKSLRSDRRGEYMSEEFLDHLKEHGIISHRTPPYTSQHNGVSERRNRTLLDMVRFMMSQTTLPKSFWDYALESVARILNMVPTKKVDKTPYEVWHGQAPKLSYLKVWGCEALVKRDTLTKPDKLEPKSIKCIFVGYPKETMRYSFYYPLENKIEPHFLVHYKPIQLGGYPNGQYPVSVTTDTSGQIKILPPKTAEEIVARERERKARTTLLMAIPEDHLAKFHKMTDAKDMWNAIKSRFGGRNDESTRKMRRVHPEKQQFGGFTVSILAGDSQSAMRRFQKSSQSTRDSWSRNKPGMDSLSFDDLYNNLRVFENDVKGSTASSSNLQNVAFVSENTSSTNDVSTAYGVSNTSGHNSKHEQTSSYSLLASQSSCPQLDHEDLERQEDCESWKQRDRSKWKDKEEAKALETVDEKRINLALGCTPHDRNYLPSGPDIEIDDSQYSYGPGKTQPSESESQTTELDICDSNISTEPSELVSEQSVNWKSKCRKFNLRFRSDAPIIEEWFGLVNFAKATTDESNKWHRKAGHVNFKNLNRLVRETCQRFTTKLCFQNVTLVLLVRKRKQHNEIFVKAKSENQANLHAGQQESNQNTGTKDKIDARDSEKEDESDQDCFELPIWHSYSSTNKSASKSNNKRGGPREEEQVFLDDLARLQNARKGSQ
ncbi:retrotransposon protein, putative, ty1-copia subclass [Tanacetum coccineum]|uniref:Retrotransposon protein, putative, ty1-copia subclass n=1 Tax=Tanacetum coccineum TaxID=301880 RepID=A0ABQ5CER2_9ASTR